MRTRNDVGRLNRVTLGLVHTCCPGYRARTVSVATRAGRHYSSATSALPQCAAVFGNLRICYVAYGGPANKNASQSADATVVEMACAALRALGRGRACVC